VQSPLRRVARALSLAAVCAILPAASASAATTCDPGPTGKPFLPWLDVFDYAEVPGGSFESGLTEWTVSPGARVQAGNEPWRVGGAGDSQSLYLPAGASVTSPSFCGGLGYPTVRMFSRTSGLPILTRLRVEVLYTDSRSLLRSFGLLPVTPLGSWQPSLPLLTLSGLPLLTGSRLAVRLTAVGAAVSVDDVYVDPYSRH
jgi:hypothetical protein